MTRTPRAGVVRTDGGFRARPGEPKAKITDSLIEALRQDIVTGRLSTGDKMPTERKLADQYGVSQPTVREVLRGLEVLGLVEVFHGSGTYVGGQGSAGLASALLTLLQIEDVAIPDVQAVRGILGAESVALAAASATPAQIEVIQLSCDRIGDMERLHDVPEMYQLVLEHQKALSAASNNPLIYALELLLALLVVKLQSGLIPARKPAFWSKRALAVHDERKALTEAIRSRDPDAARAAGAIYYGKVFDAFVADPVFNKIRMSSPDLAETISDLPREFKHIRGL